MGKQKKANKVPFPGQQASEPVLIKSDMALVLIKIWQRPDGAVVREILNKDNQPIGFGVIKEAPKPQTAPAPKPAEVAAAPAGK